MNLKSKAFILVVILSVVCVMTGAAQATTTYLFLQTDWSGGQTANDAVHPVNNNPPNDWKQYSVKDANLDVSAGTEIDLSTTSGSVTQTTDADFNAGTKSQVTVANNSVALTQYTTTCNKTYTGAPQTCVLPAGVSLITVDMTGAKGGLGYLGGAGGKGARVQTTLSVTPGSTLNVYVGGSGSNGGSGIGCSGPGGYNGGGNGGIGAANCGGGGGGASDIRIGGIELANRVVVAAAAGGGGSDNCFWNGGNGGAGGGTSGNNGTDGEAPGYGGGGGTSSGGGIGGATGGANGTSGIGGNGGAFNHGGGGGGGGYYGGGGGGYGSWTGGGGGGGSSYTPDNCASPTICTPNYRDANGYVNISYSQYYSSGTFTSGPMNLGPHASIGNFTYTTSGQTAATSIAFKAKSYAAAQTPDFTGCTTLATANSDTPSASVSLSGYSCVNSTDPYIYYQAVFNTSNTAVTPSLDQIDVSYNYYPSQTLTSSAINTTATDNRLEELRWNEDLAAGTGVTVSLTTAATKAGLGGTWYGYTKDSANCTKSGTLVTCPAAALDNNLKDGVDNQWVQYKAALTSTGANTPTFSDAAVYYISSVRPIVVKVYGGVVKFVRSVTIK